MKEKIKYYYDIDVNIEDNYIYDNDGNYYKFILYERNINDIKDICSIINELNNKGIKCNDIILNINNEYISDRYILIKLNYFKEDYVSFKDIVKYNNLIVVNNSVNWFKLWCNRVDYLEYKITEIKNNKIKELFYYYVGLAENAIVMLNNISIKYDINTKVVLSRNRVSYPCSYNDYFNPVNFIFDSRIRDISEYLKFKFFYGEDILDDVKELLKEDYSIFEYNLLYARLLFPTYFFDLIDNYLINNTVDLNNIINRIEEYELTLKQIYFILNKKCNIERVDWIIKKEL